MLCDGDLFVVGELPFDMGLGKEVANFLIDKGMFIWCASQLRPDQTLLMPKNDG
jgi:hypothetical protein